MDRKKLLKPLVYLMLVIFLSYILIQKFHWDYSIWWVDMPMHFLGGVWEGWLFLWFFSLAEMPIFKISLEKISFKLTFKTILFVLCIGISWEFFEFFTQMYAPHDSFNVLDTVSDVFFDLAGATFAVLYCVKRIMPTAVNKVE
jgi:hypothetical protein